MLNINENTVITGLEKTGCSIGHLQDCLHTKGKHEKFDYSYFGKSVSRGTTVVHTKNGDFTVAFEDKNGWAKRLEVK